MAEVTASETEQAAPAPVAAEPGGQPADDTPVAEELLVEEISIDGMCGVY
jgi:mycofactocin precursor